MYSYNNPPPGNLGFSLVSVTYLLVITALSLSLVASMLIFHQSEKVAIYQNLARSSLKYEILQTLQNRELRGKKTCSCQFKGKQITRDRNKDGQLDGFSSLKSGCHSGAITVAKINQPIGAFVKVNSIRLADIKHVDTIQSFGGASSFGLGGVAEFREYSGNLVVNYGGPLVRPLASTEIPMYFTTNRSGYVQECGANENHTAEVRREINQIKLMMAQRDQYIQTFRSKIQGHRSASIANEADAKNPHPHNHKNDVAFHSHGSPPPTTSTGLASTNTNPSFCSRSEIGQFLPELGISQCKRIGAPPDCSQCSCVVKLLKGEKAVHGQGCVASTDTSGSPFADDEIAGLWEEKLTYKECTFEGYSC